MDPLIRTALRDELLALQSADLDLRARLVAEGTLFGGYHPEMTALHQRHAMRLREILAVHGWPGRSLVGEDGSAAAWLLLQHSITDPALMKRAEPLVEAAVRSGDAPGAHLAYLTDRIRTLQGLPQIYGTQHDWDEQGRMSPQPIEAAEGVEARRAAIGMESLASHTARLREQARREGAAPPADLAAYREEGLRWARSVGWRD